MGTHPASRLRSVLAVSTALLAVSCGTRTALEETGQSCVAPTPCGGDVVGVWSIDGACTPSPVEEHSQDWCRGISFSSEVLEASGTLDFRADGTLYVDIGATLHARAVYPNTCIETIPCQDIGDAFRNPNSEDSTVTSASCSAGATTCECTIDSVIDPARPVRHTYTVEGTRILDADTTTGTTSPIDYCVNGGRAGFYFPEDGSAYFATRR